MKVSRMLSGEYVNIRNVTYSSEGILNIFIQTIFVFQILHMWVSPYSKQKILTSITNFERMLAS